MGKTGLIEVVLENVRKKDVANLLIEIVSVADDLAEVLGAVGEMPIAKMELDKRTICAAIDLPEDILLLVIMGKLQFGSTSIKDPLLRLVKYEDKYDIDFSFEGDELSNADLLGIYEAAIQLTTKYYFRSIYLGLEPATDTEGRFYTWNRSDP